MTKESDVNENDKLFLGELFSQTQGDSSVHVSTFDIGTTIGLDKDMSSKVAEELIYSGLVEIVSLAGHIGITEKGLAEARRLGLCPDTSPDSAPKLGDAPVLDERGCQAVTEVAAGLKVQAGRLELDFGPLTELTTDLKTIDVQLTSSRVKTAIIRECFRSILNVLEKAGASDGIAQVKGLLGT
jgi:hypothetical protein